VPLANLRKLETLNLRSNQITNLVALTQLTKLRTLALTGNRINDLRPLAGLRQLKSLDLSQNKLTDLGPLTGLTNLESLHLQNNQITDLRPLANLRQLKVLSLQNNRVADRPPMDLAPLARLTALTELHLTNNQIIELNPLAELKGLRTLSLWGNQVTNLTSLAGLVKLKELTLIHNPKLDVPEISKLQAALPKCNIHHNATRTIIQFVNQTKGPITIRWINFGGVLETYEESLPPNQTHIQNTYVGHQWILFSKDNKELGRTFGVGKIILWAVTEKGLKPVVRKP